jgi:hypothetical protein
VSIAYSTVDTGASITSLDPFVSAIFKAPSVGARIDRWIPDPATAETLSKLKKGAGHDRGRTDIQFEN